jgi:hypothetical protein
MTLAVGFRPLWTHRGAGQDGKAIAEKHDKTADRDERREIIHPGSSGGT